MIFRIDYEFAKYTLIAAEGGKGTAIITNYLTLNIIV